MSLENVNPSGGAIAIGHPIDCTGARITLTLPHELQRLGGRDGLQTVCIGLGQSTAAGVLPEDSAAPSEVGGLRGSYRTIGGS